MRKLFTIIVAVLLTASVFAQTPQKMSYQAVIRDASDNLITGTQVGMQISILQGSAGGTAVYVETQNSTTNANGLVTLEIGTGTTNDDFSAIDWASGPYFIKTETDPSGHINYTITGTHQLLSVPYALYAKKSGSSIKQQTVFTITLPPASTVAGRCSAAKEGTDYPTGWILEADSNPIDLKITHGLEKRVANVTIFSITGDEERQLFGNAAYSGIITLSKNILRIESLATIERAISIYIIFE
jgi:hypothetical protein